MNLRSGSGSLIRFFFFFFFQAEDGIRDSVAARGLGDVYKRQHCKTAKKVQKNCGALRAPENFGGGGFCYFKFSNQSRAGGFYNLLEGGGINIRTVVR